jgi:putative DNA primase/helicase
MKSPAVAEALQPLRKLEATARVEYEALSAEYEAQADFAKLKREAAREKAKAELKKPGNEATADSLKVELPDEPVLRRYTAHQSSVQALGELLRQNPNGLLVERDELASLLSSLSQEEQAEARGFYLTGADGFASYTFDTIGRGLNLRVPAVCLSLIGTTQPGKIGRYLRQAQAGGEGDDGLMQRFGLMVWPDAQAEWVNVDRWPDSDAKRRAAAVFERLDRMTAESVGAEQDDDCAFLRFAPEALEVFTEWRTAFERRLRSGELHPALESHFAKYRKLVPALALLIHLADGGTGPVGEQATLQALAWAQYLETHARRAYGAVTAPEVAAARAVLYRLRKGDLPVTFSSRDVWRPGWAGLADRETVRAALTLLCEFGWLRASEERDTGGRPATVYAAHPRATP